MQPTSWSRRSPARARSRAPAETPQPAVELVGPGRDESPHEHDLAPVLIDEAARPGCPHRPASTATTARPDTSPSASWSPPNARIDCRAGPGRLDHGGRCRARFAASFCRGRPPAWSCPCRGAPRLRPGTHSSPEGFFRRARRSYRSRGFVLSVMTMAITPNRAESWLESPRAPVHRRPHRAAWAPLVPRAGPPGPQRERPAPRRSAAAAGFRAPTRAAIVPGVGELVTAGGCKLEHRPHPLCGSAGAARPPARPRPCAAKSLPSTTTGTTSWRLDGGRSPGNALGEAGPPEPHASLAPSHWRSSKNLPRSRVAAILRSIATSAEGVVARRPGRTTLVDSLGAAAAPCPAPSPRRPTRARALAM